MTEGSPRLPPLSRLHSDETTRDNRASHEFWSIQTTDAIVDSLKPGRIEPLFVHDDGVVIQGNTRIMILEERGYDVDSLPRVVIPRSFAE